MAIWGLSRTGYRGTIGNVANDLKKEQEIPSFGEIPKKEGEGSKTLGSYFLVIQEKSERLVSFSKGANENHAGSRIS